MQAAEAAQLLQYVNWGDVRRMDETEFEGTARVWAEVLSDMDVATGRAAAREVLRARTSDEWRPVVPGDIRAAARALDEPRLRAAREQQRAVTNDEAAAEWAVEKAFRAEHGVSRLAWAMKQQEDK